jgi:hypothetical protein
MNVAANENHFLITPMAIALALLAACGEMPDDETTKPAGPPAPVGYIKVGEAFDGTDRVDKASDYFERASGGDSWLAWHLSHLCLLSGVGGDFNDYGQAVVDWAQYEFWRLHWSEGVSSARGICTNWNNFVGPSGYSMMLSNPIEAEASGFSNDTEEVNAFQGDAATFFTGVIGEMQSETEYLQTTQATTAAGFNKLRVRTEEGDALDWTSLKGFAHGAFVGVPQQRLARFFGFNSSGQNVRGTATSSNFTYNYAVSTVSGYSAYWLTDVNNAVCGLTRIAGNFDGTEERVRIWAKEGWWFMQVWAHPGKAVSAKARCMAYDQR